MKLDGVMAVEIPSSRSDWWRVESVSDDGVVEVLFPDGERCTTTVARELVPKFQRIVERDWDDGRREQRSKWTDGSEQVQVARIVGAAR